MFAPLALLLVLTAPHAAPRVAPAGEEAHIRGRVVQLRPASSAGGDRDFIGRIVVEGEGRYDRASIAVRRGTRLSKVEAGRSRRASFDDLRVGDRVRVWFAGPVLESYPVQATAREIHILGDEERGAASSKARPDLSDAPVVDGARGGRQTAAASGGYLDVGGAKIFYEARGEGPAVVLVHDGLAHSEIWDAQWEVFSRAHRVIRYDRRGYGRSELPARAYSEVDDLHALLRHLGVGRATLIGSSAGGDLVMQYALAHPGAVERLVLIGPVVSGLAYSEHFLRRNRENSRPLAEKKDIAAAISNWAADPYIIAPGNDAARKRLKELLNRNPQNLTRPRLARAPERPTLGRLGEIKVPTLVLVGESDTPEVHAHAGAIQAGIAGAQRVVIPRAGHLPYAERPEEFNRVVLEFLPGAHHAQQGRQP